MAAETVFNAFQLTLDESFVGKDVAFYIQKQRQGGVLGRAEKHDQGSHLTNLWVDGMKYTLSSLTLVEVL